MNLKNKINYGKRVPKGIEKVHRTPPWEVSGNRPLPRLHFGNQFLHKMGGGCGEPSVFFGIYVICWFFGRPRPPLAQSGLDFGGFGLRFWRFRDSILRCFRHDLAPVCSAMLVIFGCSFLKLPLVIGGLVGLREAQRI